MCGTPSCSACWPAPWRRHHVPRSRCRCADEALAEARDNTRKPGRDAQDGVETRLTRRKETGKGRNGRSSDTVARSWGANTTAWTTCTAWTASRSELSGQADADRSDAGTVSRASVDESEVLGLRAWGTQRAWIRWARRWRSICGAGCIDQLAESKIPVRFRKALNRPGSQN